MSTPFIGEIRLFAGNFAPAGWSFCNGAVIAIADYDTLFALIGTTYGGDGVNTFALPDLRGRVPLHQGNSFVIGQQAGTESVTLLQSQMPVHTHALRGSTGPATAGSPGGNVLAATTANSYGPGPAAATMSASGITAQGGSLAHNNMAPFTTLNYIISLFGIFPSQN